MQNDETVHSFAFGEFFDRMWLLLSFLADLLRDAFREFNFSWMDDVEEAARRRRDEDLVLYPAP